jgi:glutamine---fructose-6-phosphate transaminase (isomerizing)
MTPDPAGDVVAPTSVMAHEIAEQPGALARTLDALLPLRADLRTLAARRRHVLLVARGSSDNAAVYGRYLLETHSGLSAGLAAPSVATHYRRERDLSDTVVVSLSQSGRTEEIVQTQRWARACGAATVAVTNVADSPLAHEADIALETRAGRELAVPATKSYTTQLAALAVLATALADEPTALDADLARAPAEVEALLTAYRADGSTTAAAVDALADAGSTLVTGRGLVLGTALEVALKMEETCLRPVRGLSYADLRHGPIAVVSSGLTALLVAAGDGPLVDGMADLAADLRERGATVLGFGGDDRFRSRCDVAVPGPGMPEALAPLGLVVPAQLVVESLARRLGLDPDAPRGLSKVTQTDRSHDTGTHPSRRST